MDGTIPTPPSDPNKLVQPPVVQVLLLPVRVLILKKFLYRSAPCCFYADRGVEGGYPEAEWDVGIVILREDKKRLIAPRMADF
jgi:hypothetical protein